MKKVMMSILLILLLLNAAAPHACAEVVAEPVQVVVKLNQYSIIYANNSPIFIDNGRVMIPVNMVEDMMGAQVDYGGDIIKISLSGKTILLCVNSDMVIMDGQAAGIGCPVVRNAKTLVPYMPIRVLLECFGFEASWDNDWKRLEICDERIMKTERVELMRELDWDGRVEKVENADAFAIKDFSLVHADQNDTMMEYGLRVQLVNQTGHIIPVDKQDIAYWIFEQGKIQSLSGGARTGHGPMPEVADGEMFHKDISISSSEDKQKADIEYIILWPRTLK